MHRAPAVNFTVKRASWHLRLIACFGMLALVLLVFFSSGQTVPDQRTAILALAVIFAVSVALLGWAHSPRGTLRWDGQHWYWSGFPENQTCSMDLLMDFQSVMVVKVDADGQHPFFLWLEATPGDLNWRCMRRAIVSSRVAGAAKSKDGRAGVVGDPA
jgi:hypothetical protein